MGSLVNEEPDRVSVDGDFEDEIRRRAGLYCLPENAIVVAVDQRLVQVQHKRLAFHQTCKFQIKSFVIL